MRKIELVSYRSEFWKEKNVDLNWINVFKNNLLQNYIPTQISLFHIPKYILRMNILRQIANTQVKLRYVTCGNKCT